MECLRLENDGDGGNCNKARKNNRNHHNLSVRAKCRLLNVSRSNLYYEPRNLEETSNLYNEIYELWLKHQFLGYRKITAILRHERGYNINQKKVLRLMKLMNIGAIYPKKKAKFVKSKEYKYPYLLKNLEIKKPDKVWSTDITYIKTPAGFVYLSALVDIFSRFIVSWKLSISMTDQLCLETLDEGIKKHKKPEIVNSDQGSQYTGHNWVNKLQDENIKISMDGKGRWADNIFIERFWRTVKQEEIFINPPDNLSELKIRIERFIDFYNYKRPHQSLNYNTPSQIYYEDEDNRKSISF